MPVETVPFKIIRNGDFHGDDPAYYERIGGAWKATDWRTYADQVISAGKAMIALGIEPGDVITILGFNQPSWVIADVAAMAVGAVPAGIYTTNSPRECHYILDHSESPLLVIEDEGQWAKIEEIRDSLPNLRHVVVMSGGPAIDDPMVMSWEDFNAAGADVPNDQFDARLASLEPDQLATLIYTSGTTGPPKGVMLTHDNLVWTASQAINATGITKKRLERLVPAAFAHRRADLLGARTGRIRLGGLLRRVDRQTGRQPERGPADRLLCSAEGMGEIPRRGDCGASEGDRREGKDCIVGYGRGDEGNRAAQPR